MASVNIANNLMEPVKSLPNKLSKFKQTWFYYISDKHGDRWANRNAAFFIMATWATVYYTVTTKMKNSALRLKEEKKRMKPDLVRDALARAGISSN
ncbi:hypothetical protein Mgra_00008056 [Meloidogyne graminicola]|uniref:Uncharacterized protein n=1 Tax=Meloidogyne graminicola TaxID=189291 RepID=A0A8S9ZH27_9BILA|nr:hypothetical protein Mgra_00008056 [Meloidogyne graminicola]